MDKLPLNMALLRNPLNWAIVLLMVAIGGLAVDLVFRSAGFNSDRSLS